MDASGCSADTALICYRQQWPADRLMRGQELLSLWPEGQVSDMPNGGQHARKRWSSAPDPIQGHDSRASLGDIVAVRGNGVLKIGVRGDANGDLLPF